MAITALLLSSSLGTFCAFGIYLSGASMLSVFLGYVISAQILFVVLLARMGRRRPHNQSHFQSEIENEMRALNEMQTERMIREVAKRKKERLTHLSRNNEGQTN